jgi:hypothetical protein
MDQRPNILRVEDAAEVKQMCGRWNREAPWDCK